MCNVRYLYEMERLVKNREISPSGCWIWTGCKVRSGYGTVCLYGKMQRVHRVAYTAYVEEPGDDLVLHKCNNRACFNPAHLYAGTPKENVQDAIKAGTHRGAQNLADWWKRV